MGKKVKKHSAFLLQKQSSLVGRNVTATYPLIHVKLSYQNLTYNIEIISSIITIIASVPGVSLNIPFSIAKALHFL